MLKIKTHWKKILSILGIVFFVVATSFLMVSRIYWPNFHNSFGFDQSRDAGVIQDMRRGILPSYGPSSSKGDFSLFPHFYYILYVFGFWTTNPTNLVYFNAISSIITFFLLFFLVWKICQEHKLRWLWSGAAVFIYSINMWFIREANMIWNPNSLPMFILILILALDHIQTKFETKPKLDLLQGLKIAGVGFVSVIAMSLHSSALFMIPVWILWWVFQIKNIKILPKLSIALLLLLSGVVTNIPYFISEFQNKWKNTIALLRFLKSSSDYLVDFSFWDKFWFKIHNFIFHWLDIWSMFYLPNVYGTLVILLGLVSFIGLWQSAKQSNHIVKISLALAIIYLLVCSNLTGISPHHYKLVGVLLPLVGLINFLQNINFKHRPNFVLTALVLAIICFGTWNNYIKTLAYSEQKFGQEGRTMNTQDYQKIVQIAKDKDVKQICVNSFQDRFHFFGIQYFAKYEYRFTTKFNEECDQNLTPNKSIYYYDKGMGIREKIVFLANQKLIFENEAVQVYEF